MINFGLFPMAVIRENYSLKKLHTFGMDVAARWFAEAADTAELAELITASRNRQIPHLILGGGSNILFTRNADCFVIRNNFCGIERIAEDADAVYVRAGAGEVWHTFVMHCIENGYAGIENLSLIPGSVGAGPMQNIGAYGVELKDVFHELEAWHIASGEVHRFSREACKFGYRESVFKRELRDQYVITAVTFRLLKKPVFNTSYGAIEQELQKMDVQEISIKAISQAVINIRSSKLPDPAKIGNAGSFFKNPVVSREKAEQLKAEFPNLVSYKNSETEYKLAAGWLIEQCGWKGFRKGDAGVHKDQALVLVNYADAKGNEVYELSQQILDSVYARFGVQLEREVNIF